MERGINKQPATTATDTVLDIEFWPEGNSRNFTRSGWHNPEPDGTWTSGFESVLSLPRTIKASIYRCVVFLTPYVDPLHVPFQEFQVLVGGAYVHRSIVAAGSKIEFEIPASLTGNDQTFTVRFRCPMATIPASNYKGADSRCLGVLIGRIVVTPQVACSELTVGGAMPGAKETNSLERAVPANEALLHPSKTLAVVTMSYNEPDFLTLWLKYYGNQIGLEHCYVIDHGSDDSSSQIALSANRFRIPRSPLDEVKRAEFVSNICSSLLNWYDYVIYCDVDEIIVADPENYNGLLEFCRYCTKDVVTSFGMNLIHQLRDEDALDPDRPILGQRKWAVPAASMCKPALTRVPIKWGPGFHSSEHPLSFDRLVTFHLAYVDLDIAKRRQQKRRNSPFSVSMAAHAGSDNHHRASDAQVQRWMEGWARMPSVYDDNLTEECPYRRAFIKQIENSYVGNDDRPFKIDLNIWGQRLLRVPERFQDRF